MYLTNPDHVDDGIRTLKLDTTRLIVTLTEVNTQAVFEWKDGAIAPLLKSAGRMTSDSDQLAIRFMQWQRPTRQSVQEAAGIVTFASELIEEPTRTFNLRRGHYEMVERGTVEGVTSEKTSCHRVDRDTEVSSSLILSK